MKKNLHSKIEIRLSFRNVFNALMYRLVFWLIKNNRCQNTKKFKEGDLVVYNWKAKYYLGFLYFQEREGGIKKITAITKYSNGSESCDYINLSNNDRSGCDVFWVRKCYFWERLSIKQQPNSLGTA